MQDAFNVKMEAKKIRDSVGLKVAEYLQWFENNLMQDGADQTMHLVIAHTQSWSKADAIIGELEDMERALLRTHRHGLKTHKVSPRRQMVLRRVFMAKMLKEIYGEQQQQFGFNDRSDENA